MTFGEVIRMHRKRRSMQLQDLAQCVGVSRQYMSDIEHDKRAPLDGHRLAMLAHTLNLSPVYLTILVGRLPPIPVHADIPERVDAAWRAFLRALIRPAKRLPNDEQVSTRLLLTWEHLIEQSHALHEAARILENKHRGAEAAETRQARDRLMECARAIHHSRIRLGKMDEYRTYMEEVGP